MNKLNVVIAELQLVVALLADQNAALQGPTGSQSLIQGKAGLGGSDATDHGAESHRRGRQLGVA